MTRKDAKDAAIRAQREAALQAVLEQIVCRLSSAEVSNGPDWSEETWAVFKRAAFIHGVAPLLHDRLKTGPLPEQIKAWLEWQYESNEKRVGQIQADLQAVLAQFSAAGIPLMPLKGALLASDYYQDRGLRPTADIDLLIHPPDLQAGLEVLARLGYEVEKSNWKHAILSRPDNQAVVSYEVEHADNPRRIDLHVACQEMFSGPVADITAEMWANAAKGKLLGEQALILKPEMLWLHLLLHTGSNIWNGVLRLINLVDIACVQETAALEPAGLAPLIASQAPEKCRFFYPALFFCRRYLPQTGSPMLLEQCETAVPPSFRRWLAGQDLLSRSRLREESRWDYLARVFVLYRGRPKDLTAAVRFLLQQPIF